MGGFFNPFEGGGGSGGGISSNELEEIKKDIEKLKEQLKLIDGTITEEELAEMVKKILVENKSKVIKEITIEQGKWDDSTYTIEDENITEDNLITISLPDDIDEVSYRTCAKAEITAKEQSEGRIVLQAFGEIPTSDFNIIIAFENELV